MGVVIGGGGLGLGWAGGLGMYGWQYAMHLDPKTEIILPTGMLQNW